MKLIKMGISVLLALCLTGCSLWDTNPTDATPDSALTEPTELPTEAATEQTEPEATEPSAVPTEPTVTLPQPTVPQPTQPQATLPQPTIPQPTQPQPTSPEPSTTRPTAPQPTEPQPTTPPEPSDEDFVRIIDYIPIARVELAYATEHNFTGSRIYDFTDGYLRYGTVKKLRAVNAELERQGVGLIIWDGFRPVAAQARLWEICPDPTFVSHPVTGKRTHCRGNTVDISVYDLATGEPLPVPTVFDDFSDKADRDYSDCSADAAANARLLEQTMEKYGFNPYFAEWWHYSDTQDYPVEETFNPAISPVWTANCNEYINLRSIPDGDILREIPKGGKMELRGWEGKYALVSYRGITGYVLSSHLMPQADPLQGLDTVQPTHAYSYERMLSDLEAMKNRHPEQVSLDSIGTSALGRNIPVMRIGDPEAEYHVLLQGAIHGREHMTAWLLMAMADYWLDRGLLGYGDVCYHIIPMSNPDGVIISQTGILEAAQYAIYLNDLTNAHTAETQSEYASLWKANGEGVDINRNFPSGWDAMEGRTEPSAQQYKGTEPFSAPEAAALRDYTLRFSFDATISYHATGSVLYYAYGNREPVNTQSRSLAKAVKAVSGYPLAESTEANGAGYKDWAMEELSIPSLTVEIGCGDAPLAHRELYSIFIRNYHILPAIARWLQGVR